MLEDQFAGRIAVVTGAGQGVGEAVTRLLVARGARVAAVDMHEAGLKSLVADLGSRRVTAHRVDVADADAVRTLVDDVEQDLGPIHYLVNVAGVLRPATVLETADEDWERTMAVNAGGVFHMSRAAARRMARRRAGAVVTVGSNAAGVPRTSMAAYAASKAAAAHVTRCLGLELARSGVRCNIVSPGSTDTAMQRGLWDGDEPPASVLDGDPESYRVGIPLGRIADPRDIAEAVAFLLSDRARHITMQDLYVDGGATLHV